MSADAFYTGLVADLYGALKSTSFRADRYSALIRRFGEPALELGCGDGDPLLELREEGLDANGVDSSPDMIRRLHERATEQGLTVDAWVASMETMRLPRTYRTIFLAGPTFNLLPDDEAMAKALSRIEAALASHGTAVIPVFVPAPVGIHDLVVPTRKETPGGWIGWQIVAAAREEEARTQTLTLRYERVEGSERETLERDWVMHWISVDRLTDLAGRAGLHVIAPPRTIGPRPTDIVLRHA